MNLARDNFPELREAVAALCKQFDSAYWQQIDEKRAYPEKFVDALTKAGWMSALIPEEFGGSGLSLTEATVIMEEIGKERKLVVNATGAIGALACELGIDWRAVRGIGVMARAIGLVGHILEEAKQPMALELWERTEEEASAHNRPKK